MTTPEAHDPTSARAVALRYRAESTHAPEVVAKGQAEMAERILACAREHGIPVREDRDLVELLAACDLGTEIPEELYQAVARLLTFLYRLNAAHAELGTSVASSAGATTAAPR